MGSYQIFLGFSQYDEVFTLFFLVLLVLPGFTYHYLVLSSFNGFYLVLQGFTGFYWVLPGCP